MNENVVNNNESVEEVPLDLFNQVSLDNFEPSQEKVEEVQQEVPSQAVISVPASAYKAALQAQSQSQPQPQSQVQTTNNQ